MNDQTKIPKDKPETKSGRDARLNAALRDNLMRRKAAQKAAQKPSPAADAPATDSEAPS